MQEAKQERIDSEYNVSCRVLSALHTDNLDEGMKVVTKPYPQVYIQTFITLTVCKVSLISQHHDIAQYVAVHWGHDRETSSENDLAETCMTSCKQTIDDRFKPYAAELMEHIATDTHCLFLLHTVALTYVRHPVAGIHLCWKRDKIQWIAANCWRAIVSMAVKGHMGAYLSVSPTLYQLVPQFHLINANKNTLINCSVIVACRKKNQTN